MHLRYRSYYLEARLKKSQHQKPLKKRKYFETRYQKHCNYTSFAHIMIIIEHIIAGPKTIVKGLGNYRSLWGGDFKVLFQES
jgi:hypothetical protein